MVDVGTFLGGSAEALLAGMPEDGRLITVDKFTGTAGASTANVAPYAMLRYATERLACWGDRVTVMVGASASAAGILPLASADLIFLDAAHDYENVKADIRAWLPVVKPDGIIAGHDLDKITKEPMSLQDIIDRSDLEWDASSGLHCGVIRAVFESFETVNLWPDLGSTIWTANPSDFRRREE